jgi:8-oxo-dGTP pyrophosphatase MutT (NUDIX family)
VKPLPTSIKGVLLVEGGVVLVRNPRNEWELPGGRIEPGETPESTLAREFEEELSLQVNVGAPIDSYVFEVVPERNVRILTYGCTLAGTFAPRISDEHSEYCVCPVSELAALNLPSGYRQSIERWSSAV